MSDTVAAAPSAHELLLALAGWVDDDLLTTGRELVAVGEEVPALELLVASLAAGRTVLPDPVRAALVDAAVALRVEPHPDRALPPGVPPEETTHRFAAEAGPPDVAVRVAGIGTNLPVVARSGARVSLVWRLTPAGAAPGPLPHPVLLAAVQTGGPVEVLAYQLGAALARAGVPASVEAFVDGTALPPYHRAALAEALPLDPTADDAVPGPPHAPQARAGPATPDEPRSAAGPAGPAWIEPADNGPVGGGPVGGGPERAGTGGIADELLTHRDAPLGPVDGPPPGTSASGTPEHVHAPDGARPDATPEDVAHRDPTDSGPGTADSAPPDGAGAPGGGAGRIAAGGPVGRPAAAVGLAAAGMAAGSMIDDGSAPDVSTPSGGVARPVGPGPSGSPSGPAPGAGPFDDGLSHGPDLDTPAYPYPYPATAPPPDDGARADAYPAPGDEVPRPGAGTDRPVDGHPAPRPAPRRISPGPENPEWFADPTQGPATDGVPTPANGSLPTGGPRPVPSTGPITLPRPDDALNGPLDRPLLDSQLDRADGPGSEADVPETGGHEIGGYETGVRAPGRPATDTAYPGEDAWDRDWATGAWSTAGTDVEPVTGPTPSAGAPERSSEQSQRTHPRLRSVSGPPPILRAPVPPGPRPAAPGLSGLAPSVSGPSGLAPTGLAAPGPGDSGPGPLRPTPVPRGDDSGPAGSYPGPETIGPADPTAPPEAVSPPRPRHRLDVPDPPGTAETEQAPADGRGEAPDLADLADLRTDEQPTVDTDQDRPPSDETGHSDTRDDEAGPGGDLPADTADDQRRVPDRGTPTATPTGDRDIDARAQHPAAQDPAAQDPTGHAPQDPSGNGHRPAPRPSGDSARRPAPGPDLGGRLTPNEQGLLRRLQEELAARDNGAPDHGPQNGSAHPDAG